MSTLLKTVVHSQALRAQIRKTLSPVSESFLRAYVALNEKAVIKKVQKKHQRGEPVTVCFMVMHDAVWKLDHVFQQMLLDKQFNPVIVVTPYTYYGEHNMHELMENTLSYFRKKEYPIISTYDQGQWLDIREEVKPDIVFFTNPHAQTRTEYGIKHYLDKLTIYVPYHHQFCTHHSVQLNELFHNLTWKNFYVHPIIRKITSEVMDNKGRNVVVTGYPGTELLYDSHYLPDDVWKIKDRSIKRIIWAVHNTITSDDGIALSNFLDHAESFKQLAIDYRNKIQVAFKPHPILKNKLYEHKDWGEEKTNTYFNFWANQENTQLEESAYEDLCLTSDAMIHDCGSFILEYLYLNKPVMHSGRSGIRERLNPLAQMGYDVSYKLEKQPFSAVLNFIDDVVIGNKDELKPKRSVFINKHLLPGDGIPPSRKIVEYIKTTISTTMK